MGTRRTGGDVALVTTALAAFVVVSILLPESLSWPVRFAIQIAVTAAIGLTWGWMRRGRRNKSK